MNRNSKYNITKEFLEKEYIENKKSLNKIAKELKCSVSTVYRGLLKANIKLIIKDNRIKKTCEICSNTFYTYPSINKKTCSEECCKKLFSKLLTGKGNGNYIDGRSYGKDYYCKCGKKIDKFGRSKECSKCRSLHNGSFKGKKHTKKALKMISKKSKAKFTKEFIKRVYIDRCQGNIKRDINGYTLIKDYNHPNKNSHNDVLEHILIMSKHLNRSIKKGEVIHHINFIRNDNRIENLHLYKNLSEHGKCTRTLFKLVKSLLEDNIIEFKNGVYIMKGKKTVVGGDQ